MKKINFLGVGALLWATSFSLSCDNQVEGGGSAFETPDEAFDACCDKETGDFRADIAACAQYRDDNDLDPIAFCDADDGTGGDSPIEGEAFSSNLDIQLDDGRSKAMVWSQDIDSTADVIFEAQADDQVFNIAIGELASPNWVARITLAGPPQMANTWSLPNAEVPYIGTNDPVERYELIGGTVEMTRCAGAAGEVFEVYIDASLQDLFGTTSGTVRGFLRSRAQTVGGQFECPPI